MNKYKLAVFDMDGTILDTLEDLKDSLNHCLCLHGFSERTLDEVRHFVGNGIRRTIEQAVPEGTSTETIDEIFKEFGSWYIDHCNEKTRPYDGIVDTIRILREKGVLTAVVSNKGDAAVKELSKLYYDGLFDVQVGERPGIKRKPWPDSVNEVLKTLDIRKEDAVYIGDSEVDLKTAENAGLPCISVLWGFRDLEMLKRHGGTTFIDKPIELIKLICES